MERSDYDLCVIGGGVNGAGIARDAAGRGLSVLLLEARDLASATSSASTKLIHGGLRYLEFFEFKLVKDSLKEREVLLANAPHIIWPMEFILPHVPAARPFWIIRLGLFLYDHLAPRRLLKGSYSIDLHDDPRGKPLSGAYEKGFCYSDCWVDDARLVILNALDAAAKGAHILTYHQCTKITKADKGWRISYTDKIHGRPYQSSAARIINAAGPWVSDVIAMSENLSPSAPPFIKLVKGSHIIINRAFEGQHAYILQQIDKRIVFVLPYEGDYTLIGTTEEAFEGDAFEPRISDEELDYLCNAYNSNFKASIGREDVLWTYSGVRPLFNTDKSAGKELRKMSRDYILHDHKDEHAPMISVFGGKLTTYRVLSEKTLNMLAGEAGAWTAQAPLPGGDFPASDFSAFCEIKQEEYPWLPADMLYRYARAYGTRMDRFLSGARSLKDLGEDFGASLTQAELTYLIQSEFARKAEDVLWRRSKLGMHMTDAQHEALEKSWPALLKGALKT